MLLKPNKSVSTKTNHIWPSLSDQQWVVLEQLLKDLILADYGRTNNVKIQSLTQTEIRDIIMGAEIAPPCQQKQQIVDIEKQAKQAAQMTAVTTATHDKHGNQITAVTTSPYNQRRFISESD